MDLHSQVTNRPSIQSDLAVLKIYKTRNRKKLSAVLFYLVAIELVVQRCGFCKSMFVNYSEL